MSNEAARSFVTVFSIGMLFLGILAGLIVHEEARKCRAAFAWSRYAADSAWVIILHPECGVGVTPPARQVTP